MSTIMLVSICAAIDLDSAKTPSEYEAIEVSGHRQEEFNGKYKYIDEWNDQPHFKNENEKHIYFHKCLTCDDDTWNLDSRDQTKMHTPGSLNWKNGG